MSGLFKSSQDQTQNQSTSQNTGQNFNTNTTGATNQNTTGTSNQTATGNTTGTTTGTSAGTNNQTSTGVSSNTTAGTAPDWVTAALRGVTDNVLGLGGQNPSSYVANPNPSLTNAALQLGNLSGQAGDFNNAADLTRSVATADAPRINAATAAPGIQSYLSPYEQDVIDSTRADLDHSAGQTRAAQDLQLAGSGAFGGSGAALTKATTEGELARARGATMSGLLDQNYTRALGAAQSDADRKQQAATTNAQLLANARDQTLRAAQQEAGLGTDYESNLRANIGANTGVGQILQAIQQQQAGSPLALAQFTSSTLPSMLSGFFGNTSNGTTTGSTAGSTAGTTSGSTAGTTNANTTGSTTGSLTGTNTGTTNGASTGFSFGNSSGSGTTTSNPSAMSDIGDIVALASMFMSDRRLKRDVRQIGELSNGLGLYAYRYLWSPIRHIGVMAQEVLGVKPEAVITLPGGWLAVDYARI